MELEAQGDIMHPGPFLFVVLVDRSPVVWVVIHIGDGVFGIFDIADQDMESIEVFDIAWVAVGDSVFCQSIGQRAFCD